MLFPDVKGFRPPDRAMSATDARVGQRFAQGMSMTEATREDVDAATMAESNMMVDRDEDYNTRYGGYKGNLLAFERTKLIPRSPAKIDLTAMVARRRRRHGRQGRRPLSSIGSCRSRLADRERGLLVDFLRGKLGSSSVRPGEKLEESLRELLYLVLSTPEYQVG